MTDAVLLHRVLSEYASTVLNRYEISDVLYKLVDHAVDLLQVDGAGVSIDDGEGQLRFVAATDEAVIRVEERQIETQQGPCHQAFRTGEQVAVDSLAEATERWPHYASAAIEAGCRAVAGIPMKVEKRQVGALNVYRRDPQPWTAETLETAQLLADLATGYLVNARTLEEATTVNGQLQQALRSRVVIEQAKGVLSERHAVSMDAAFDRLRSFSRSNQRKLHDVAAEVVAGRLDI